MVTVLRAEGFRFVIFSDDHEPAHVHVFGDGEAKINLASDTGTSLVWAVGMKRADLRKCMRLVHENRDRLLARWNDIHG